MELWSKIWHLIFFMAIPVSASKSSFFSSNAWYPDIMKLESCNVSWNRLKASNFKAHIGRHFRSFDVDVYSKSNLTKINSILFNIRRCKEAISYNTCEHFATWRFDNNPCEAFKEKHAFWAPVIQSSSPPFQCPFKGDTTFKFHNSSIDFESVKLMNIPSILDAVWEFQITVVNQANKDYGCLLCQGKVVQYRRKDQNK